MFLFFFSLLCLFVVFSRFAQKFFRARLDFSLSVCSNSSSPGAAPSRSLVAELSTLRKWWLPFFLEPWLMALDFLAFPLDWGFGIFRPRHGDVRGCAKMKAINSISVLAFDAPPLSLEFVLICLWNLFSACYLVCGKGQLYSCWGQYSCSSRLLSLSLWLAARATSSSTRAHRLVNFEPKWLSLFWFCSCGFL